ncbi:SGNH/GDSL hydrolase family protein [Cognaticolwellia mytili]|uniref:SGNH/GDSL hydrolase family protein n=1 Tax=Cognaticolwellia mytili TaxID=1888913 RepID=UPI001302050B|nr:SGNH/GDSL hydrolase family protein [Cognaticolwellia mytili]
MVTALIFPLLLLQAIAVRLTVLRLPEPDGERSGYCGDGSELRLLIVGDSAAAGVGVTKQAQAISGQLTTSLAEKHRVNWLLVARTGFTSSDLIAELNALPSQQFNYVLISVGVNDVTGLTRAKQWSKNITTIAHILKTKFGAPNVIFSGVPPMEKFKAIPFPLNFFLGKQANKLNELMITALACEQKNTILKFDLPFKPEYLAKDGIHPSELAYSAWAQQTANECFLYKNEHT